MAEEDTQLWSISWSNRLFIQIEESSLRVGERFGEADEIY